MRRPGWIMLKFPPYFYSFILNFSFLLFYVPIHLINAHTYFLNCAYIDINCREIHIEALHISLNSMAIVDMYLRT